MALVAQSFHWTPNADNTVSGSYPAGDKPPDAVDLAWDASALAALVATLPDLEPGTPFTADVRAALTGTNAASATIGFGNVTGDEPVAAGWTAPGAGDDLAFDALAEGSGSFQLAATYSGDTVNSVTITWACVDVVAPDYPISSGTSTYDAVGVPPGSTITIPAGTRGTLTIKNAQGTVGNRITIRGPATGQAIIRRTNPATGGFVFILQNCAHVNVDGSDSSDAPIADDGKRHGIKVMYASSGTTDGPSAFVKCNATNTSAPYTNCHDITFSYLHIDGGWPDNAADGIGILTNHAMLAADFPGQFQENIVIEHCCIQRCQGEGIYAGNNPYSLDVPLKNIHIRYNYVADCGWEGMQPKSWYEGTNTFHDNTILRCGLNHTGLAQNTGVSFLSCVVDVYNNWIEDSGAHGLQFWTDQLPLVGTYPTFECDVYNNVIIRSGQYYTTCEGITAGASSGATKPLIRAYNNTIVDSADGGIVFGSSCSSSSWVRNNIVLGSGGTAINDGPGTSSDNTTTGNPATVFTDYATDDFTLAAAIAASGTVGVDIAATDYAGTARPQGATSDRGAYEKA